jgi:diaminopimelate decarboxylase
MSLSRDASGALCLGGPGVAPLFEVVHEAGTPAYVYSLDGIAGSARTLRAAFDGAPHQIAYAVKANTAGAIVAVLADAGCGADVVSGAELRVALACGVPADAIVFSGVAKTDDEIDQALACGTHGIGAVQLESLEEIARVEARARAAGRPARVGVRINPSVDLAEATHAHIATGHDEAKFGVPRDDVARAVQLVEASAHLQLVGMTAHAGSQFVELAPYVDAARALFALVRDLREAGRCRALAFVDSGGGFGVDYGDGKPAPPPPGDFVRAARAEQRAFGLQDLALHVEPGRALVAAHGVLVARVIQSKVAAAARWLMIDAGMNDLVRPALYQARHRVVPLDAPVPPDAIPWRVVGPVCESSDDFGEHVLPRQPPALVALLDAGAYGYTMASRYNGRQSPAEIFLQGGRIVGRVPRGDVDGWVRERASAGRGGGA